MTPLKLTRRNTIRSLFPGLFLFLTSPLAPYAAESEQKVFTHTIYLIRHGSYTSDPKADAERGPGLTALGIAQARLLAARLKALPVRFSSITSSTMTRAKETAAVIHETLSDTPLDASALLSECTPPARRESKDETPQEQAACAERIQTVFQQRFKPAAQGETHDLIVAHGNVIRYLVTRALGVDPDAWLGMSVAHTSLTVVRIKPDGVMRVLAVGDVGYLPSNMQSWGSDADPQLGTPASPPMH